MTDTKHTPGPWRHADTTREGHPKISGAGLSGLVATVGNAENNQNRIKADARLIAAAPELLSLVVSMNHMGGDERGGYCICPRNDGSSPDEMHATICVDARATIARATEGDVR